MSYKVSDHIWQERDGDYKCVVCGAVVKNLPKTPLPSSWLPPRYELPLTEAERDLAAHYRGWKRIV